MKRTTISLPDDLASALQREAGRRRVSVSEIVRDAIEARLGLQGAGPRPVPIGGLFAATGPGVAREDEAYLADHWPDAIDRDR